MWWAMWHGNIHFSGALLLRASNIPQILNTNFIQLYRVVKSNSRNYYVENCVFSCSFIALSFEEGVATLIQILFFNVIVLFFHPQLP